MIDGRRVDFNVATTISFSAAAMCLSFGVLGAYLGRAPASRHFRYAAAAAFAGSAFCVTNAVVAGGMSVAATIWAGRVCALVVALHGAAWIAFLAAWERRPLSRLERVAAVVTLLAGLGSLVPGWTVAETVTVRTLPWGNITYRDPDVGPLAIPLLAFAYAEHVIAALAAVRMSRRHPRARVVAAALGVFCVVMPLDSLSSLRLVALPYFTDPALALVFMSIASVVVLEAAESAAKSAELERSRAVFAERENLAALGQLAAVVAHEVRNPVAIIFGALAAMQRAERSDADGKLLGIIGEEAERLKQLIVRLLDAVRPFELQYSVRDAGQIVRTAIAQVAAGNGAAPAQIELVAAPMEEVECDEVLLGQAISNLVQNALVASGRRSPVRVLASVEQATPPAVLRVEVSDDGDGVALELRPRLFTPFFTTRATGTGLGLALVKRIAGAHGGSVEYEPQLEGGARFVLCVPLRAQDGSPRRLVGTDVR